MTDSPSPVQATATAFRIIEALRQRGGAGVSELAAALEMPTSTVHDHLRTLEAAEYLTSDAGVYHVGVRFLELGEQARGRMKIHRVAKPEVDELAAETGEHANLMIEEHGHGVFLYKAQGDDAVQLDTHAGMRVPLHTTALGKAILAHSPTAAVDAIVDRHGLQQVTDKTITTREALDAELETVRRQGFAFDDEERVKGMRCVAAPVIDAEGTVVGAVSVSGPKSRMLGEAYTDRFPRMVLRTANVIEVNLTYS
jgi:transcriptional regulator, IclR family